MNISFLAKTEKRYEKKIRYIVDLFFSTYGVEYRLLHSFDQLAKEEFLRTDMLLFYGSWQDYQDLKEKVSPPCHLLFVSQLFQQLFDQRPLEVKTLKREGADSGLPILYASPRPMQKGLYQVEEKSGRVYTGVSIEKSENRWRIVCCADFFASSFYLLTLQEEKRGSGEKGGERFLGECSWKEEEKAHHIPLVNHYFGILFELLQMVAREEGIPLVSRKVWPAGSALAVALTHDVDILDKWSLYVLFRIWVLLKRGNLKALTRMVWKSSGFFFKGNKSLRGIELLLEREKKEGFNSTFFFLAGRPSLKTILKSDVTYPLRKAGPGLNIILNEQGEVGLHGSLNSYLARGDLEKEKESLDECLSSPCLGIRQHFLRLKVPQTWRAQSESGFLYDCTLGYSDRSGFRGGFAFPFRPYDVDADEEIRIWEINTNVMDQTYDKYDRKNINEMRREIEKLSDQLESANGGLLTLLWHTNVLEEFGFPGFLDLYGELLDGFARRGAFVTTAENIVRFWMARKEVKLLESKTERDLWEWRYQSGSPVEGLTFHLTLPQKGEFAVKADGAEAIIRLEPGEALVTFPHLNGNQIIRISLVPG